jgi:sporulation protein YlmC with PRC-barrel domain
MKLAKPMVLSFSLLAFAGAAQAQQGTQQTQQQMEQPQQQRQQSQAQEGEMRANELIGMKVTDSQGKELGEISELVLDLQGGKVHAAVLEFGGILGMGEKNYAFPVSQLKQGKDRNQLTMDIDKQKLENAEGFAKGEWPEMDAEYWGRVGGQASAGETRPQGQAQGQKQSMVLVRASELEGKNVQDKSGEEVGEIRDVMVDLDSGELRNIVIDVKEAGEANVPAKSLTKGTGDQFVLSDMSADQLRQQAKQKQPSK